MARRKMDPEVKAKWVAALRSGEYKQGRGALETWRGGESTYCCLGVLCHLALDAGIGLSREVNDNHDVFYVAPFRVAGEKDRASGSLPVAVSDWAGIEGDDPYFESFGDLSAIEANDIRKFSFDQIADLIEENL